MFASNVPYGSKRVWKIDLQTKGTQIVIIEKISRMKLIFDYN